MTRSLSSDAAWQVRIGEIVAPPLVTGFFSGGIFRGLSPLPRPRIEDPLGCPVMSRVHRMRSVAAPSSFLLRYAVQPIDHDSTRRYTEKCRLAQ
jgi:hypothetical protein